MTTTVSTGSTTLAGALWPAAGGLDSRALRAVVLAVVGSALIAVSAKINVPMYPVPMTLQTLAIVLIGAAFGWKLGMATVMLYLAEGVAGLPVFAGPAAGPAYMTGPTAGYLVGFVFAAGLVGWLAERGWDRHPVATFFAMLLGVAIIIALGLAWLSTLIGFEQAVVAGFMPFAIGELVKCALAALALPGAWALMKRYR